MTSVSNLLIVTYLEDKIGYQNIFYIGAGCTVLALVLNFFFNEKLDVERLDKKAHLIWTPKTESVQSDDRTSPTEQQLGNVNEITRSTS